MKSSTINYIKRLIYLVFALTWMITVFNFSNEPADTSQNTSLNITKKIVETFVKKDTSTEQKEQILEKTDHIVRKLAHFTLYAIGGFLIFNFINTYNFGDINKIIYSLCTGVIYACTDEIHQLFIEGRSGQITDVMIDSLGVITGLSVFLCVKKIVERCKAKI